MSPPNIPVTALTAIEAIRPGTPLGTRADARSLLPQAMPGQVLSARVDAVLPDGNFRVTVTGQPLSMALPKYFAPGDTLDLVFVAREPRLTFTLNQSAQAAPAASVSSAGRMIAGVLPRQGEAATLGTVVNAPPLLAAAPEDGAALSAKLQGTLTQSGLFYESHQAEWILGKRDLAVLMREPQARLEPQARAAPQSGMGTQGQFPLPAQQQTGQAALPIATPAVPNAAAVGVALTGDAAFSAAATRSEQAMPQALQALVQQQLAALETGRLVFQLQVWPDQWMQWEIDEEAQHASAQPGEGDAPQSVQTRLHLDLPRLGALDATLSFDAAGVRVRLKAAQASSAETLQDNRASLRAALADAGLPSVDIAVARHGQD